MQPDQFEPIALDVKSAVKATGLTRSAIFDLIRERKIDARKHGRRNLILASSLRDYIASLPPSRPLKAQSDAA